jgi:hypothetical protein
MHYNFGESDLTTAFFFHILMNFLRCNFSLKLFSCKSCSLLTQEALSLFVWRCATVHSLLANKRGFKTKTKKSTVQQKPQLCKTETVPDVSMLLINCGSTLIQRDFIECGANALQGRIVTSNLSSSLISQRVLSYCNIRVVEGCGNEVV